MRGLARLVVALLGSALAAAPGALAAGNAYVTNDGALWSLDYGSAGLLAPMAPPIAAPAGTRAVAITPDGRTLYATAGADQVAVYQLSPDGVPTLMATATAGSIPWDAVVSPDGRSLYVADSADPETISPIDILADG